MKYEFESELELVNAFRGVFQDTDTGRRVLKYLESMTRYHSECFDFNPHITSYQLGARSIMLKIKNILETDISKLDNKEI
jgi:hypothetical protein